MVVTGILVWCGVIEPSAWSKCLKWLPGFIGLVMPGLPKNLIVIAVERPAETLALIGVYVLIRRASTLVKTAEWEYAFQVKHRTSGESALQIPKPSAFVRLLGKITPPPLLTWAVWIVAIGLVLPYAGYRYLTKLEVVQITGDLHMLKNRLGGNVSVLRTGGGAVVVDTMSCVAQGEAILNAAQTLTGEAVALVVNSHYHLDHTHGNPAFPVGTRVISTARTLEHLRVRDACYWQDEASALLPNETFNGSHHVITLGDKTIQLVHPGRGHTDGDLVVLFVEDRALHAGDLYFNRLYPNIDLEAGGSVRDWGDTLERVLELDFEHVIPGHGDLADRADVRSLYSPDTSPPINL